MNKNANLSIETVKNDLKVIIAESLELNLKPEEIKGDDLINELNINSVDALEILVRVENKYQIVIPDEDLNASLIATLDNFSSYVFNRCKLCQQ